MDGPGLRIASYNRFRALEFWGFSGFSFFFLFSGLGFRVFRVLGI